MIKFVLLGALVANGLLLAACNEGTSNSEEIYSSSEELSSSESQYEESRSSSEESSSSSSSSENSSSNTSSSSTNSASNSDCTNTKPPPYQCTQKNEQYVKCPDDYCQPKSCKEVGFPVPCPGITEDGKCQSKPACLCIEGYVKNNKGLCVPKNECPPVCKENEVYSDCINGGCFGARNCSEIGRPKICVRIAEGACRKGCLCKEGYLRRDKDALCVPEDQCPPKKCGKNEVLSKCLETVCRPLDCSQKGQEISCIQSVPEKCTVGCVCAKGYLKNPEGDCVKEEECLTGCGGDPYAEPGCGYNCGRLCSNYKNKNPICPRIVCKKNGCDCKPGYVLDTNLHKCVKPKDCTPVCQVNEVYSSCINGGCFSERNCTDIGKPEICVNIREGGCIKGCLCKDGYLKDKSGKCIPRDQCPNNKCKRKNERYVECPDALCTPKTCDELGYPLSCPLTEECPGKPGCVCIQGYVKNHKGDCIHQDQCPSCGGDPHAKPGCGINCGRTCTTYDKGPVPCPLICKLNGCDCKEGYVLDNNKNKCVKPKDCTKVCGENEVFDTCINGGCYSARNCSDIGRISGIICVDPIKCISGCLCAKGYLKNKYGKCVLASECPEAKCGKNQIFDECGPPCPPQQCGVDPALVLCAPSPKPGDPECQPSCRCIDGYVKNGKGDACIPRDQCPSKHCKKNEELNPCPPKCPPRVCGIDDRLIDCAPQPQVGDPDCPPPACICKNGFYKNDKGDCVPWEKCPACTKPNEVYSPCPNPCPPQRCDVDPRVIRCKSPPQIGDPECRPGCICADGFVKNGNGTCVTRDQCETPQVQCKANEKYFKCVPSCPPQGCRDIGKQFKCPAQPVPGDKNCKPGCRCKPGFWKNSRGDCIAEADCKKCTGPNEYFSCGGACDNECDKLKEQSQDNCPIINIKCNEMCYCDKGHARDVNGKCIPIDQCPKDDDKCPKHEHYEDCPGCAPDTCAVRGKKYNCPISTTVCKPACRCNKGYFRLNGKCVPEKQCPKPICCGTNEMSTNCLEAECRNQNCSDRKKPKNCGAPDDKRKCTKGCVCKPDHYRNSKGLCVHEKDCDKTPTCGDYEVFSNCTEKVCRPLDCSQKGQEISCAAVEPKHCTKGCVCVKGALKTKEGKCVPEDKCPKTPKCGDYEVFSNCIGADCRPQDCSQKGEEISCAAVEPKHCTKGCVCAKGALRDRGKCVPEDKCPTSCKGDKNALPGCGVNCGRLCSNYKRKDVACILICYEDGCDCKKGYVKDTNTGYCVKPSECTPTCKANERYSACIQAECRPLDCEDKGKNLPCPRIRPEFCKKGCVCVEGYLKKNGECVKEDKCVKEEKCD